MVGLYKRWSACHLPAVLQTAGIWTELGVAGSMGLFCAGCERCVETWDDRTVRFNAATMRRTWVVGSGGVCRRGATGGRLRLLRDPRLSVGGRVLWWRAAVLRTSRALHSASPMLQLFAENTGVVVGASKLGIEAGAVYSGVESAEENIPKGANPARGSSFR